MSPSPNLLAMSDYASLCPRSNERGYITQKRSNEKRERRRFPASTFTRDTAHTRGWLELRWKGHVEFCMVFRRRKPPGVTSTIALGHFHSWTDRFAGWKVPVRYFTSGLYIYIYIYMRIEISFPEKRIYGMFTFETCNEGETLSILKIIFWKYKSIKYLTWDHKISLRSYCYGSFV